MKTFRELEKIIKGVSNHRRIQITQLLLEKPELSLITIAKELDVNFKTISVHVGRLVLSGLIMKRNEGSSVCHALTKRGKLILMFLRTLE